ncbi:hypothetical protein, partial [Desulfatitalea alkaliphila]
FTLKVGFARVGMPLVPFVRVILHIVLSHDITSRYVLRLLDFWLSFFRPVFVLHLKQKIRRPAGIAMGTGWWRNEGVKLSIGDWGVEGCRLLVGGWGLG